MSSNFVKRMEHTAPDATTARTYHGLVIKVGNNTIGRIRSWQPTAYSREGVHIYELNVDNFGRPVDYVPGIATGFTLALARVELWESEIELAFGLVSSVDEVFNDLTDQTRPFRISEFLFRGNSPTPYRQWEYQGCWFQDRNEDPADAQGDGIYTVNATVAYIRRMAIPG